MSSLSARGSSLHLFVGFVCAFVLFAGVPTFSDPKCSKEPGRFNQLFVTRDRVLMVLLQFGGS